MPTLAELYRALKGYAKDALPGGVLNPEVTSQSVLDGAAMASSPVPVVGDLLGLGADLHRYAKEPETRTLGNFALSGLGMLPFVPSMVGGIRSASGLSMADEIAKLRNQVQPFRHTLPNGEVVELTSRFISPREGAVTEILHDTPGVRRSYPYGNFSPNEPMMAGLSPQQRMDFTMLLRESNANKRTLADLIDAKAYISKQSPPSPQPEWVSGLTASSGAPHANAEWWGQALNAPTVGAFVDSIRGNQSAFVLPLNSQSKDIGDIARLFSTKSKNPISHQWSGDDLILQSGKGSLSIVDAASETPFIRSIMANSQGKKDGAGKELYQTAYNWIGNNGKVVAPDPGGISEINEIRKAGNVLAAQVRNGDVPVAEMNAGGLRGEQNIPALWESEARQAAGRLPSLAVRFDGQSFSKSDQAIEKIIKSVDPTFSKGVGLMTAKRKAVLDWLKTATPEQARKAAESWKSGALFPAALMVRMEDDDAK